MSGVYIIPLDTHCQSTEFRVISPSGRFIRAGRCQTTITDLTELLTAVRRPRHVVFEEGPLADWLLRNLQAHADEIIICDPRRNALIAKESDKDDPIDAEKLGQLYRGGYIRRVHHADTFERVVFKQLVALYHDRVRNRTRLVNRILAQLRQHGVFVKQAALEPAHRRQTVARLPAHKTLRALVQLLLAELDLATSDLLSLRRMLVRRSRRLEPIRRFVELPGIHWVRAATFFAYVDTPWRFPSKSALWKYLGIGLERRHSGSGPQVVRVPAAVKVCRPLKNMILSAAQTAINQGDNPFADQNRRWLDEGLTPRNARRNVARGQASVLWGLWKSGDVYRPERVGVATVAGYDLNPS
ncbi:MAG: transposase [Phycisphaerae bacterium]|nr:transposase [Phycisphaerae bacterium]